MQKKADQPQEDSKQAEQISRPNIQDMAAEQEHGSDETMPRQKLLNAIGEKLTAAREARIEKVDQAVRTLKLRKSHLEALEQGRWDLLPDEVYALGFLRQYSQYLDLDLSHEIKQLQNDQYTLTKPLTFPDPPVSPSRKWAWLTAGAFALLFVLFNVINNSNNQDTGMESSELTNREDAEMDKAESELAAQHETGAPQPNPAPVESEAVKLTHKPIVNLEATQPKPDIKKAKAIAKHLFRFEAVTGAVWIQIFAPDKAGTGRGPLLKEVLLQQGQYSSIKRPVESLWINCGNALALRVKVDGKIIADTGTLGSGKKVLRDYHFNINRQ